MDDGIIHLELDVEDAQEVAATLRSTVRKIDWVLENKPPKKKGEALDLDTRAKQLSIIATEIEAALNKRALANSNGETK